MQFDQVVFYGRLGHQALTMFNLDSAQLRGARVLDCAGGPGSLSALLRADGVDITVVDPLYALSNKELKQRALADLDAFLIDRNTNPDSYIAATAAL